MKTPVQPYEYADDMSETAESLAFWRDSYAHPLDDEDRDLCRAWMYETAVDIIAGAYES